MPRPPISPRASRPAGAPSEMRAYLDRAPTPQAQWPQPARAVNSATLLDMTSEHQPVLATELIELLSPQPGETAVDCTFGGGGHARLMAAALGSSGTLICIDRDPAAEARFNEFAAEVPCQTRFLGVDYAEGLRT